MDYYVYICFNFSHENLLPSTKYSSALGQIRCTYPIMGCPRGVMLGCPRGVMLGCPRGVMVKAMNCGIVVREFVLQSRYYVHFRANTLGKGMNPLILPPAMGK